MKEKELQLVLEEGEGYKKPFFQKESFTKEILYFMYNKIEFKESLASIDKEMVAFANSSGGRIFLGITDDKKIKGVKITNKLKFRKNFSVNFSVNFGVKGKQLKRMVSIIIRAAQGKDLKIPELADEFDVTTRTLYEDMKKLWNWDIFKFVGAPKTGRYVLTEKGKKMIEGLKV